MAEYHWIGSTAGNIDSLRWGNISNWRVVQLGTPGSTAPGGTLARLVPATRLPLGNQDVVYFGPPSWFSTATQTNPARYNIQSPCLFGGVTTAAVKVWEGSTAGSTITQRHGVIPMLVSPRYPFSRLGGYVDAQILNEWKDYTNALHGTAFAGWTLASGAEYDNAQYVTIGSTGVTGWHGLNASGAGTGNTAGISFAQQTSYTIRGRGYVTSAAHARTTVTIAGFTGATAGATTATFDGSNNTIKLAVYGPHPFGAAGNRTGEGFTGQEFPTNLAPEALYDSGAVVCSGHWNKVACDEVATRKADISLDGAVVNALVLKPVNNFTLSSNGLVSITQITSPATSAFELGNVYINETSSLRFVQIASVKRHSAQAEVTVLGDITPIGGFVCALPAGPSAGASGGVFYPNGSLVVESPAETAAADTDGARVNLGFALYDGSSKATTEITSIHVLQNTAVPMTVVLTGPLTSETVNLHGGALKKGDSLKDTAPVDIDALNLHGNAVYDISSNPEHRAGTVTVLGQSSAASVKLGAGTALTVGHVNA